MIQLGDDYFRLKARAYLPKSQKNSDIILALDSGIIKEVSVGCAVEKVVCSVCGEEIGMCAHKKGEIYGSKICCCTSGVRLKKFLKLTLNFPATYSQSESVRCCPSITS